MTKEQIIITDEKVEINGKTYLPEDSFQKSKNYQSDVRIVVLQRGWIHIGRWEDKGNGQIELHNSYNIQSWGTTKGLGELCTGPTTKTVLNKNEGIVYFREELVVFSMCVDKSKYSMI
jgi:hypothetical protein